MGLALRWAYRGCSQPQSPRRPRPLAPEKLAGASLLAIFAGGGRGHSCPHWLLNTLPKCGQRWRRHLPGASTRLSLRPHERKEVAADLVAALLPDDLPTVLQNC